jgi:CDGSH-type Zn-finger protein
MKEEKIEKNNFRIKVVENGPYLVLGNVPLAKEKIVTNSKEFLLAWKKTKDYPQEESYLLCRCGKSKNAPYCDKTHLEIKFDGKETAGSALFKEQAETYNGEKLKLLDARPLCASGHFCTRAGGIWELVENSDDSEAERIAIEESVNCPAGRLVLIDRKTGKEIEPNFEPAISAVEDTIKKVSGPLWAKGRIPIESANGMLYELRNRVTLCRCGKSSNKPFCNSAHVGIGFRAKEKK